MKKNRLLMVAMTALTVGALVACGGNGDTPEDPGTDEPNTSEVPTEAGKVTFYFTLSDKSVALDSYASYYLTGGFIGFATGTDAYEMQKNGDTNIYYCIVDVPDTSKTQGNEYQIVKGYNSSSNMAASKLGLQWVDAYKSDEELALEALKNLTFEFKAGDAKVDLGTHTFSTAVSAPSKPLANYTLSFKFKASVPEYATPYVFGSFSGWRTPNGEDTDENKAKMAEGRLTTVDPERKVWTKKLDVIYADNYVFKLLVEYSSATLNVTWNAVDETQDNTPFTIYQSDGDNYTLDMGEFTMDFDKKLPDPTKVVKVDYVFVNSGTAALPEGVEPGLCGDFLSWTYTAMTHLDDGTWALSAYQTTIAEHQLGVINMKEGATNWAGSITAEGGNNLYFTLTAESKKVIITGDYSKLGGAEKSVGTIVVE